MIEGPQEMGMHLDHTRQEREEQPSSGCQEAVEATQEPPVAPEAGPFGLRTSARMAADRSSLVGPSSSLQASGIKAEVMNFRVASWTADHLEALTTVPSRYFGAAQKKVEQDGFWMTDRERKPLPSGMG